MASLVSGKTRSPYLAFEARVWSIGSSIGLRTEEREELLEGIPRQAVHQPEVIFGDLAHVQFPIEDVRLHAQARQSHSLLLLPLADVPGDHVDEGCSHRGDDYQSPLLGLLSNRGVVVAAVTARAS